MRTRATSGQHGQNNLVAPAARDRAHLRPGRRAVRHERPDIRRGVPPGHGAGRRSTRPVSPKAAVAAEHRVADQAAVRQRPVDELPRPSSATACPPADLNTFTGPDTNSTGLAVQGLAAYGGNPGEDVVLRPSSDPVVRRRLPVPRRRPGRPPTRTRPRCRSRRCSPTVPGLAAGATGPVATRRTPHSRPSSWAAPTRRPTAARSSSRAYRTPTSSATVQAVPALAKATLPLPASTPTASGIPRMPCAAAGRPVAPAPASCRRDRRRRDAGRHAGACPGPTGVTVAVDFTAFRRNGPGPLRAGDSRDRGGRLQQAGFTRPDRGVRAGLRLPDQQPARPRPNRPA